MKKIYLSVVAFLSLFLFSCQKDDSIGEQPDAQLAGEWKFLNFTMDGVNSTESFDEIMGAVKIEIFMNYLSANSKGTISFSGNKIISNQLSYDVTGSMTMKTYIDGNEVNTIYDSTLNIPMPTSSSTTNFIQVSPDSIYCPNGSFIDIEGAEDMKSKPGGLKLKYDGDKLIMTATQKETATVTEDGVVQDKKSNLKMVMIFQKN